MLTLDYNTVISHQFHDVEKSKKKVEFAHSSFGKWINSIFSLDILFNGVNTVTTSQLLKSKGLLAELKEHYNELEGKDLNKSLNSIKHLLDINITLHSIITEMLEEEKERSFQKLFVSKEVLAETIENLYSIIRLLKRANLKKTTDTSQMAIDSSSQSLATLEKVIYGGGR